ncbi:hypothetical protein BAQ47_22005 [Bacillus tropicus]|nr:hypothetical protein BAQ47_22005 [Bacillus tropicus]
MMKLQLHALTLALTLALTAPVFSGQLNMNSTTLMEN